MNEMRVLLRSVGVVPLWSLVDVFLVLAYSIKGLYGLSLLYAWHVDEPF